MTRNEPSGGTIDPLHIRSALGDWFGESIPRQLVSLDAALHELWKLGRNIILVWAPRERGIEVIVLPHYAVADIAAEQAQADNLPSGTPTFVEEVVAGPKHVSLERLAEISRVLRAPTRHIDQPFVPGKDISLGVIDRLVRRYSLSFVQDRAVALFDIVNFSLYSPLEQVTQLNSLAYSVNAAHSKLLGRKIDINFARSTTGDGFYIWNRDRSIQANVNLYHFMHLVLADNAIARTKSKRNSTPLLRTCFDIGGHYEFYQSEGLSPTVYSYIVGDVTIGLARMIEKAIPGQVVVGDFRVPMPDQETGELKIVDSIQFIEKTQETLASLTGLVLSGDEVESIRCYLTGERKADGTFGINRYLLTDKHGLTRTVYNAKINIYRKKAPPIYLGVQDRDLGPFDAVVQDEIVVGAAD